MKLEDKWIDYLTNQPESGMGFQHATVTLKDGTVHDDITILNCSVVMYAIKDGDDKDEISECPFSNEQISNISVKSVK